MGNQTCMYVGPALSTQPGPVWTCFGFPGFDTRITTHAWVKHAGDDHRPLEAACSVTDAKSGHAYDLAELRDHGHWNVITAATVCKACFNKPTIFPLRKRRTETLVMHLAEKCSCFA
jgi:hypothetical protein